MYMTHEALEPDSPDERIPDGFGDFFAALAADMGKPSPADQRERLKIVTDRFRQQWSETGLLTKLYDATPEEVIGGQMSLQRVMYRKADGADVTELYVHVEKTESISESSTVIKKHDIPVAQSLSGLVMPALGGRFDQADAELVYSQAAELDKLRTKGDIPDLQSNLLGVLDPSRSIMVRDPRDT